MSRGVEGRGVMGLNHPYLITTDLISKPLGKVYEADNKSLSYLILLSFGEMEILPFSLSESNSEKYYLIPVEDIADFIARAGS